MGNAKRRKQLDPTFGLPQGFTQQRQSKINLNRVRELRYQIEIDLGNAVTQGYLSNQGVYLAYREEHMPELPEAAKLYQEENPDDTLVYLGKDPDDGKYTIQITPSLKWLFSIREMLPNFTFEKMTPAHDPMSS